MEFNVNGRNLTISERFREYTSEKVAKLESLAGRAQRIEAKVSQQSGVRSADSQITVELTVFGPGPVIRAEAKAGDKFAAFDIAYAKLSERLRRVKDKKKIHRGRHTPVGVAEATAALIPNLVGANEVPGHLNGVAAGQESFSNAEDAPVEENDVSEGQDSPVLIRRKVFPAGVMSVDDAVDNMELVGHDFYLFIDVASNTPSVVYRRRGWTYGVISLETDGAKDAEPAEEVLAYRAEERTASVS